LDDNADALDDADSARPKAAPAARHFHVGVGRVRLLGSGGAGQQLRVRAFDGFFPHASSGTVDEKCIVKLVTRSKSAFSPACVYEDPTFALLVCYEAAFQVPNRSMCVYTAVAN
jgi:hypothetical protein